MWVLIIIGLSGNQGVHTSSTGGFLSEEVCMEAAKKIDKNFGAKFNRRFSDIVITCVKRA